MAIKKEILDELLKDKDPKTMFSSDGLLGELKKALAERVLNAEMDHHDAYDEYNKNPSADTLRKLDEAGVKRAQATKALEAARQDLIDHATPEHQAAWQAANDALKQATYSEMDARDELKAAQDAAAETPNVPPPPQPGTPVPNVHPPQ